MARICLWFWRFREERLWARVAGEIPAGAIVSRRFSGYRLHLELARSSAHWRLWCRGDHFAPEQLLLESLVRPGWHVIDVGANIGYLALALSAMVGERGDVLCFEPDADNLRELRRNLEANGIANAQVSPRAVGAQNGMVRLRRGLNARVDAAGEVEVEMMALDAIPLERLDLIKIDVEGFEGEVLRGARGIVERLRPALFVEVHPTLAGGWSHRDLVAWIRSRYARTEAYESGESFGLIEKVRARYLRRRTVPKADLEAVVAECEEGRRRSVFWIVARQRA